MFTTLNFTIYFVLHNFIKKTFFSNFIFGFSDASSDSGVEEDKSPKKADTPKKSEDGKVTRPVSLL